jgi:hypothetical protein
MFVKRFGIGIDLAMPNTDAMYIKTLLEDGAYEEACEKLIDYYGENSVVALNDKIRSLKDEINRINDDRKDLRESNEAEHREKVCYMDKAEEAAGLLQEVLDVEEKKEYRPGIFVRIHKFLGR